MREKALPPQVPTAKAVEEARDEAESSKQSKSECKKETGGRISSCWSLCVNAPSSGALSKKRADLIDQRSVVILVVVIIKRIEASLDEHGEANVELHIV